MIHAIYVRNKPKKEWTIVRLIESINDVPEEMNEALQEAKKDGFPEAEVGMKIFQTRFYIPESLKTLVSDSTSAN